MSILKRHQSSIAGLPAALSQLGQDISNEAQARANQIGTLENLTTEEKSNLVSAINEVLATAEAGAGSLKTAANLSDLADLAVARTNLEVLSAAEVATAIAQAQVAMGSNFTVADIAARDALEDLDMGDRVMVQDDGDGKWAIYAPSVITEGAVTAWLKLYDQDALENSLTAAGVKAAYESNEDTNAFTDAEKVKLESALVDTDIATVIDENSTNEQVAGAAAVKSAVDAAIAAIPDALVVALETVVVSGSNITLAHAPKGGVAGVLNFGTVRYISNEGIAYDAPVVAGVEGNVFGISTDTADQWDGFSIQVQYVYTPA